MSRSCSQYISVFTITINRIIRVSAQYIEPQEIFLAEAPAPAQQVMRVVVVVVVVVLVVVLVVVVILDTKFNFTF